MIVHWDEVERARVEWEPATRAWWTDLGRAAGSVGVGLRLMDVDPRQLSVPVHVHSREEEIAFVLDGSGFSWQGDRRFAIRAGDCVVYVADSDAHALEAGDDGLKALVFGTRERSDISYLPRTGRGHVGRIWFDVTWADRPHERVAEDPPPVDEARAPNIVDLETAQGDSDEAGRWAELGRSAGSVRTGLNWIQLAPGRRGPPPHCHSAEEELFFVLAGEGTLELWPTPQAHRVHRGIEYEERPVRPGHVVSHPAGTRIAHSLRAGANGLTYLVYGTRDPNDICFYPRSNKIFFRGVGLIARLENLSYDDGEPEE